MQTVFAIPMVLAIGAPGFVPVAEAQTGQAAPNTSAAAASAVAALPNGAVDQAIGGVTYFTYGGAWYQPMYSGGGVTYQVVSKPS